MKLSGHLLSSPKVQLNYHFEMQVNDLVKQNLSIKLFTNDLNLLQTLMTNTNITGLYAIVCVPEVKINWKDTGFVLKKVLNPTFHAIAMILYLLVAIIYFVLPTLRDLAGNIITTIMVSLIVSQAADLVRIFTEFSNHVSFMITGNFLI